MIKNSTMWVKLLGESKDSLNNLLMRLFQTSFCYLFEWFMYVNIV